MKNLFFLLILGLSVLTFTQCEATGENCVCTEEFAPVCGDDGLQYSNQCFAECAGISFTSGFCERENDGIILDLGDPALDGCGWVVQLPNGTEMTNYRPDVLADSLKVDSLIVHVQFKPTLQTSVCGLGGTIFVVEILSIE